MQTKVKYTRTTIVNTPWQSDVATLIIDGELVFVLEKELPLFYVAAFNKHISAGTIEKNFSSTLPHPNDKKAKPRKLGDSKGRMIGLEEGGWIGYKPIIISKTEKIEVGDWVYDKFSTKGDELFQCSFITFLNEGRYYKVLVLPEQFSHTDLQRIVEGNLKEGKIMVECESVLIPGTCEFDIKHSVKYPATVVKLNREDHAILHKTEEKLYTFTAEELSNLTFKAMTAITGGIWKYDEEDRIRLHKQWFEENVK